MIKILSQGENHAIQPGEIVYSFGMDYPDREQPDHGVFIADEEVTDESLVAALAEAGWFEEDWGERLLDPDNWEYEIHFSGNHDLSRTGRLKRRGR